MGNNLECLEQVLEYNRAHGILFFRISSDLVPFASHPVCRVHWRKHFSTAFRRIGAFIQKHRMRVSMHPDQFIVLNSPDTAVYRRSVSELRYHAEVLDALELDPSAKIQLHAGGVYGDRERSIKRFVKRWHALEPRIRKRLVIENDERSYGAADCLAIHRDTGVPVLFDFFHHSILGGGLPVKKAFHLCAKTWSRGDGIPMTDYSSQNPGARPGSHAVSIDCRDFKKTVRATAPVDHDIMLEIKDKETSALRAVKAIRTDSRFVAP